MKPSILFVCTGNVCRSPCAEYVLKDQFRGRGIRGIDISSAGTQALVGHPMASSMQWILGEEGIDTAGFSSRALDREQVSSATLILTAEVAHRSAIVQLVPSAHAKVFSLLQFARLIPISQYHPQADVAGLRLAELVESCSRSRGVMQPSGGRKDDVTDPWAGPILGYKRAAKDIHDSCVTLATILSDPSSQSK